MRTYLQQPYTLMKIGRLAQTFLVVAFLALTTASSTAQITIFARFGGATAGSTWSGESQVSGREGWAELENVTFGVFNQIIIGGTGGSSVAEFVPVTLTKRIDRLTPQIFHLTALGAPIGTTNGATNDIVEIEFVRSNGQDQVVLFKLELKLVVFANVSTAVNSDEIFESVQMKAGAMRYTYTPTLANGNPGTPVVRSWSQVLNNATFNVQ